MLKKYSIKVKLLTALYFLTIFLTFESIDTGISPVFAAPKKPKKEQAGKNQTKDAGKSDSKNAADTDTTDYIPESELASAYIPQVYRCPDCGYEQDLPGSCPDHNTIELVLIMDKMKDPLAPTEYDGNEDILVDIPLKNVKFKKEQLETDTDTTNSQETKQ